MAEPPGSIEVVYATRDEQAIVALELREGMTAVEAVERSGLLERFPEIATRELVLGIYGTRIGHERILEAGERIEICRPLIADPRDMRRDLLAGGKVMGGKSGAGSATT